MYPIPWEHLSKDLEKKHPEGAELVSAMPSTSAMALTALGCNFTSGEQGMKPPYIWI